MSWLRLDDGLGSHPKLLELSEVKRWRWVLLLLACARHRTDGRVTGAMLREARLEALELVRLGLLEVDEDDSWTVHDWADYNPPDAAAADRQRRYRMRKAGVPEDEVLERVPRKGDGRGNPRYVTDYVTRESSTRARDPVPSRNTVMDETAPRDLCEDERAGIGDVAAGELEGWSTGPASYVPELPAVDEAIGW